MEVDRNCIRLRNWILYLFVFLMIQTDPTALASNQNHGQLIGIEPMNAHLMEDHSDAFIVWKQAHIRNRTVVHIDSHIDLEWISDSDINRIRNSKKVEALKQLQLDPLHPEERASKPVSIMNFNYPAMKEGIIKELYWVPPDSIMEEKLILDKFKYHLVDTIDKLSIGDLNSFRSQQGIIKGKIFGIPLTVCKLSDLPSFKESIVLNIDVDYFDPPNLKERNKIPFIWPEGFINLLKQKGIHSDLVTICYSVRGGYLALEFRFLGNELVQLLRDPKGSNPILARMREHRKSGVIYWSKGMISEAANEFQNASELIPEDASLHYWLGLVYSQWGKLNEASLEIARSAKLDPIYNDPLIFDADYYLNKNSYSKAISLYEKILKKTPDNLQGLFGAGLCSSKQGDFEKAAEYYQQFIKQYPNYFLVHFNLGFAHSEFGKKKLAEEAYEKALKLNPHFGKAYQNLGLLYFDQGESDKATEAFKKTIEVNPCFKESHNNLGTLYASTGKYEEALTEFGASVKIDPQYAIGYNNLGKIYLIQEKFNKASEAFQHALSIDPANPWPRYYLDHIEKISKQK